MTCFFSEEKEALLNMLREFAATEIASHAAQWDRDRGFPSLTVLAMGDLGLFGLVFPEECGGAGADSTSTVANGPSLCGDCSYMHIEIGDGHSYILLRSKPHSA